MKSALHPAAAAALIVASIIPVRATEAPVALRLDASKTAATISKYVYGQFVEHLGRSIYGGCGRR
jgi:alpha-N-arabinofuranosidase